MALLNYHHLRYVLPLGRRGADSGMHNDDRILSVAHQFQVNTDIHLKRPSLEG